MDDERARDLRRFIDTWRLAGPALEADRLGELSRLRDDEARARMLDLFALWRPGGHDDDGAELVAQQRVFSLARARGRHLP